MEFSPPSLMGLLDSLAHIPYDNPANLDEEYERLPKLFQQIDRVIIATQNKRKCAALTRWFHDYLKLLKGEAKISLKKMDVPGEEPSWANAIAVAWHKVQAVVAEIKSSKFNADKGGNALVVGSDIVAFVNGKPFHNLSRIIQEKGKLDGEDLEKQLKLLIEAYSSESGSTISYDIAIAMYGNSRNSHQSFRYVTGVRLELRLAQIPENVIKRVFGSQKPAVFDINTGLPFVDRDSELNGYVLGYTLAPLSKFVDYSGTDPDCNSCVPGMLEYPPELSAVAYNPYLDFASLSDTDRKEHFGYIRMMVMGGLPANINSLLTQQFFSTNGSGIRVV